MAWFGGRYYHPDLGRWLNRDPIGQSGGLNLYAYLENRPTDEIDPWGMVGTSGSKIHRKKVGGGGGGGFWKSVKRFMEILNRGLPGDLDDLVDNLRSDTTLTGFSPYFPNEHADILAAAISPLEHLILGHAELGKFSGIPFFGAVFSAADAGLYAVEGNGGAATWNFGMAFLAWFPGGGSAGQTLRASAVSYADDAVRFVGRAGDTQLTRFAATNGLRGLGNQGVRNAEHLIHAQWSQIRGLRRARALAALAAREADVPVNRSEPPELTARQKLMSQFDLDKNGKLEPAESEAYLKHLSTRCTAATS